MQIKLNNVPFEVRAVPGTLRDALYRDEAVRRLALRPVWKWDREAQTGENLGPRTQDGAVPLPNGMVFFVPKTGSDGLTVRNQGPSERMQERFLSAIGAKRGMNDLLGAMARIVPLTRRKLPVETFEPMKEHVSFTVLAETDHAVVELRDAGRNLSGFFLIPAIVGFRPAVVEEDRERFAELAKEKGEGLLKLPAFVVPAPTDAAKGIRRMALAKRAEDARAALDAAADEKAEAAIKAGMARLGYEARALGFKTQSAA